jgi:hypothetical protein
MFRRWRGNVASLNLTLALQISPRKINKEGCSTTIDILMIGATNIAKLVEFV